MATAVGLERDRAFYPTVTIVIASYYALFAQARASHSDNIRRARRGAHMWFRRKPKSDPAEAVRSLRQQVLTVSAADLGLGPTADRAHVWGVVMETGYPEAVATLVVLGDGTTSLYFSNGGGVIGAGEHDAVRAAGEILLSSAEEYLDSFTVVAATPFPGVGQVRFYLRTFTGTLGAEANEEDLGEGRHKLSPLFHTAHSVITAVRESTPSS